MNGDREKVKQELSDKMEKLKYSSYKAIHSSRELLHLIQKYLGEEDEQRRQLILMDFKNRGEIGEV